MIPYPRCMYWLATCAHVALLAVALELGYVGVTLSTTPESSSIGPFLPNATDNNATMTDDATTTQAENDANMLQLRPFVLLSAMLMLLQVGVSNRLVKPLLRQHDEESLSTQSLLVKHVRIALMSLVVTGVVVAVIGRLLVPSMVGNVMLVGGSLATPFAMFALAIPFLPTVTNADDDNGARNDSLREPLLQETQHRGERQYDDEEAGGSSRSQECCHENTPTATASTTPSSTPTVTTTSNASSPLSLAVMTTPETKTKRRTSQTPTTPGAAAATSTTTPRASFRHRPARITTTTTESPRAPSHTPTISLHEKTWHVRFAELQAFHAEHHHIEVPEHYYKYPQLHRWMERQQVQHRAFVQGKPSTMTQERLQALQELGMVFE